MILELLDVIVIVVAEVRTTPNVDPIGTAARVIGPVEVEISTSAKVSPAGIEKSDSKVIIVDEPAAIPVGVVKTIV